MSGTRISIVQVALAAALWGPWSLFLRWSQLPALTCAALFMTLLAVGGIPATWQNRKRDRPRSAWLWMLLFGVFDAGNTGFFFLAVLNGPVAVATLSHYLAPVLTPLVALMLLSERPSRRTYPAAALGLIGVGLLLWPAQGVGAVPSSHIALTAAFGAASAVFYATMVPFGKKLGQYFSPFEVQGIHSWLSAALLWAVAPHEAIPLAAASKVLAGGVVCGWVGGALFYRGVKHVPAGLSSVLTYLEPLVATVIGGLVFHEQLGPLAAVGAALVLGGGIYLVAETVGASPPSEPVRAE